MSFFNYLEKSITQLSHFPTNLIVSASGGRDFYIYRCEREKGRGKGEREKREKKGGGKRGGGKEGKKKGEKGTVTSRVAGQLT